MGITQKANSRRYHIKFMVMVSAEFGSKLFFVSRLDPLTAGTTTLFCCFEVETYTMLRGITKLRSISFSYGETKRIVFLSHVILRHPSLPIGSFAIDLSDQTCDIDKYGVSPLGRIQLFARKGWLYTSK